MIEPFLVWTLAQRLNASTIVQIVQDNQKEELYSNSEANRKLGE